MKNSLKNLKVRRKGQIIDETAKISSTAVIYPNVIIRGVCVIESGVKIYPGSVIVDSKISKNTIIKSSYIEKCELGANNVVGPFANVCAGTVTAKNVKIGAFSEVQKAVIYSNVCVGASCSIKDCVINKETLINSHTVFANFNGKISQKIRIGEHNFIGANSTLTAPITTLSNVYVNANTLLNEDVGDFGFVSSKKITGVRVIKNKIYWQKKSRTSEILK